MIDSIFTNIEKFKSKRLIERSLLFVFLGFNTFQAISASTDSGHGITSIEATKTTSASGNWSSSSVWSPTGVPGYGDVVTVNHALTLDAYLSFGSAYTFNQHVIDVAGGTAYGISMSGSASLDVNSDATFEGGLSVSNNTSLIVRSGSVLTVGAASLSNNATITIESGGSLIINGDLNVSNNVSIANDGMMQINGDYRSSNNVAITGSGDVFTTGVLVTSNSSSTFGSTADCNSGPCSGRNLCSFTNTVSTVTPSVCSGIAPSVITGTSNASSPTILWEKSTTSSVSGFSAASGTNNAANYSSLPLSATTWYRKTVSASGCTSKAIQQITVSQGPAVVASPSSSSLCLGSSTFFTVAATGAAPLSYKWQVSVNGTTWSDITSATGVYSSFTTSTLTMTTPAAGLNGNQYRSVVSNSCSAATSSGATLTLNNSGTWVGGTGNWSSAAGWCGGLPTSTKDVVINSGTVTVDLSTAQVKNLTLSGSSGLLLSGSNALSVYGNWMGNGNLTQTGGTMTFSGSSAQTIGGVNSFKNLTIANTSGGVSIASGSNIQTINGTLTLIIGTLTTNDNLIIDFNNGGAVAGTGSGSISGNVSTVRTAGTGWHYLGAPLDGLTYSNIFASIPFTGSNFYTYQESYSSKDIQVGWNGRYEASTTSLRTQKDPGAASDMIGYGVYFPSTRTLTFTGTYTHNKSYSTGTLSFTNSGMSSADGWHLIANPYPSYLDWASATGWTKTGITGPISYYDPTKGINSDYIPASGEFLEQSINGGSRYIPPMQAFWIQTTTGTASVSVNNNARVINPSGAPGFYRMGTNDSKSLKIAVKSATCSDETAIRFGASASEGFDYGIDSYKFKNDAGCPSIYTIDQDGEYSVNSLPSISGRKIRLNFEPASSGTFTISLKDLSNIDASTVVILEDTHKEIFQNLSTNPEYSFTAESGDEASRFIISFETVQSIESIATGKSQTITANVAATGETASIDIVGNQHDVKINFYNHQQDQAAVYIYNLAGHQIYSNQHESIASGSIDIKLHHTHSGIYVVKVVTGQVSYSEKIHL